MISWKTFLTYHRKILEVRLKDGNVYTGIITTHRMTEQGDVYFIHLLEEDTEVLGKIIHIDCKDIKEVTIIRELPPLKND